MKEEEEEKEELNYSLHIIGKGESDSCNYFGITETVEHVLLHCEAYNRQLVEKWRDMESMTFQLWIYFRTHRNSVYDFLIKYLRDTDLIRKI